MTTISFETIACCKCGVVFQVPEDFDESRRKDGRTFWCPNGHGQIYMDCMDDKIAKLESENTNLKAQVRTLKCRLIGRVGMRERIRVWWRGGLAP